MRHPAPKHLTTTLLLVAMLLGSAPASLQAQQAPTQAQLAEAQKHADRGTEFFFNKEYSKALIQFFKGYELSGSPLFLYNISLTYQKLGELERAQSAAEEALGLPDVDPELRAAAHARAFGLPVVLRATDLAKTIARGAGKAKSVDPVEPGDDAPLFSWVGWTGLGMTAVGAGLLGYALVHDGDVDEKWQRYEQAGATGQANEWGMLRRELEDDMALGRTLLYVGSGAAALGVVFVLTDLFTGESEAGRAIRIAPTDGGAQVGFQGSF